jgi:hypothetical protein
MISAISQIQKPVDYNHSWHPSDSEYWIILSECGVV